MFVPITPCRLVDTRPGDIGARHTPLGPAETATFTVRGVNGNCTIPPGATAVSTNVTIVGPTADGFLAMFPADQALPNASNLNWRAGQQPTPNAVTVPLSADGKVSIYNDRGRVDVIIDINGYFEDHHHDDRYYPRADADARSVDHAPVTTRHLPNIANVGQLSTGSVKVESLLTHVAVTNVTQSPGTYTMYFDLGPAPAIVDGVTYGLSSVTWCAALFHSFASAAAVVLTPDGAPPVGPVDVVDYAERRGRGCWTIDVDDRTGAYPRMWIQVYPTLTGVMSQQFGTFSLVWSPVT